MVPVIIMELRYYAFSVYLILNVLILYVNNEVLPQLLLKHLEEVLSMVFTHLFPGIRSSVHSFTRFDEEALLPIEKTWLLLI